MAMHAALRSPVKPTTQRGSFLCCCAVEGTPNVPPTHSPLCVHVYFVAQEEGSQQQQQHPDSSAPDTSDSSTSSAGAPTTRRMHTRLGSRLPGRILTRSKARGGDGLSSDTDLLSAVLQQAAADPNAACKGDLTRKPAPLVPGQVSASISSAVVASTRLPAPSSTAAAPMPAAATAAATTAGTVNKPRHQRSNSAGHAPKGSLSADASTAATATANDLASLADTLAKAGATGPQQDLLQQQQWPSAAAAGTLHRRSARLAASKDASVLALANSSKGNLSRASAPPGRQHYKRGTDSRLAANSALPSKKTLAAVAAAAADDDTAAAAAAVPRAAPPLAAAEVVMGSDVPPASTSSAEDGPQQRSAATSPSRRVRFAAGPLNPDRHPNSTDDGHPASEGALAVPVRRVPASYGMDLSKGNVLMLEQLLGTDCSMSVTRLKRRVGLLPPIRPPRPYAHASSGTGGAGQ